MAMTHASVPAQPGCDKCILALSGGVGGAKLLLGLSRILAPAQLVCLVNTGDDFEHLGLRVSPDLDTVMYTLAGCDNAQTGWGQRNESWTFMEGLRRLGGPDWFNLGDRDLATHVLRTWMLRQGASLTEVTAELCGRLGVRHQILPMCDEPVSTMLETETGPLPFQEYFVKAQCSPRVVAVHYRGIEKARLNAEVAALLDAGRIAAVVICPSNPFVSIDPILHLPGLAARIAGLDLPVVAVSPLVGDRAFKGPTARMMAELGSPPSAAGIAAHYGELLTGFVLDDADRGCVAELNARGVRTKTARITMSDFDDRLRLARVVLDFAADLHGKTAMHRPAAAPAASGIGQ